MFFLGNNNLNLLTIWNRITSSCPKNCLISCSQFSQGGWKHLCRRQRAVKLYLGGVHQFIVSLEVQVLKTSLCASHLASRMQHLNLYCFFSSIYHTCVFVYVCICVYLWICFYEAIFTLWRNSSTSFFSSSFLFFFLPFFLIKERLFPLSERNDFSLWKKENIIFCTIFTWIISTIKKLFKKNPLFNKKQLHLLK